MVFITPLLEYRRLCCHCNIIDVVECNSAASAWCPAGTTCQNITSSYKCSQILDGENSDTKPTSSVFATGQKDLGHDTPLAYTRLNTGRTRGVTDGTSAKPGHFNNTTTLRGEVDDVTMLVIAAAAPPAVAILIVIAVLVIWNRSRSRKAKRNLYPLSSAGRGHIRDQEPSKSQTAAAINPQEAQKALARDMYRDGELHSHGTDCQTEMNGDSGSGQQESESENFYHTTVIDHNTVRSHASAVIVDSPKVIYEEVFDD